MLFLGIVIAAAAIGYLVYDHTSKIKLIRDEYVGTLKLVSYVKARLTEADLALPEIICDFIKNTDIRVSFLNCDDTSEAIGGAAFYNRFSRDKLSLAKTRLLPEDEEKLHSFFAGFGRSDKNSDMARLSDTLSYFEAREKTVRAKTEKDIKVAWLLYGTAFLGALILVL